MRVRFGGFVLDEAARQLEREGRPVHLTPKALELLELLVGRRPNAVSKTEIHGHLWPNTFVAEVNLPVLVHELRHALEDSPRESRVLRTVARFGYAFCAIARPEPEVPEWAARCPFEYRLLWGTQEIALPPGDNLLGRTRDATIRVDHASVSRRHALVRVTEDGVTIEDCGSRNGTFVGAGRVREPLHLHDGDRVQLGNALILFRCFPRDGGSATTDEVTRPAEPPPESTEGPTPPHAHV